MTQEPIYDSYKDVLYCDGRCPYLEIITSTGFSGKCDLLEEYLYYYDGFLATCSEEKTNDLV